MTEPTGNQPLNLQSHPPAAGPAMQIDLPSAVAKLRAAPAANDKGYRQAMLYRQGGLTTVLFAFDPSAKLAEHKTPGTVSLQLLRGHLTVTAAGETHELRPGQLLIMSPGTPHEVLAHEESELLANILLPK